MGPAATRGTARNMNAPVEIAGFDFSGTARYRTVSERYLSPDVSTSQPHINAHVQYLVTV
jgi:hypothetical protein